MKELLCVDFVLADGSHGVEFQVQGFVVPPDVMIRRSVGPLVRRRGAAVQVENIDQAEVQRRNVGTGKGRAAVGIRFQKPPTGALQGPITADAIADRGLSAPGPVFVVEVSQVRATGRGVNPVRLAAGHIQAVGRGIPP